MQSVGIPLAAWAQQHDRARRIVVLMVYAESDREAVGRVKAFTDALDSLGWSDGRNVRIDYRWAGGKTDRFQAYAAELARLEPDVILSATTPVLRALLRE